MYTLLTSVYILQVYSSCFELFFYCWYFLCNCQLQIEMEFPLKVLKIAYMNLNIKLNLIQLYCQLP